MEIVEHIPSQIPLPGAVSGPTSSTHLDQNTRDVSIPMKWYHLSYSFLRNQNDVSIYGVVINFLK